MFTGHDGSEMTATNHNATLAKREAALAGYSDDPSVARSYLSHPAAAVRATAYGALAKLDSLSDDDVREALIDPDAEVRMRGCSLATRRADIDLKLLLSDDDHSVVEIAAWAIGEQRDEKAVEELSNIVYSHGNALCRESAVAALGSIGNRNGLAAILHATADRPTIRRRAVIALAPFDGPEVEEALKKATEDVDWQVRQAAEDLLGVGRETEISAPTSEDEWPIGDS